ncbi:MULTISPECIES: biotin/lipoyl-binding protein [Clostridia]|uniref:efflux RND transporter periplasmic adaptor subunit n=1 Tax=Clostridia TaxID=186801 RepID=UPI000EA1D160|nr:MULTISPECIES: biotin/lipoyl-binding protein [Clostridia]NBJ70343.1 biotin/lipoyl-binding protein [Roseburia sp. 1XD42-34]RKI76340.1 biotin/lipoyl-binding protein [Clostridium sp. 1xD42-85]
MSKKKKVILTIVIILVILGGVGGYFFFTRGTGTAIEEELTPLMVSDFSGEMSSGSELFAGVVEPKETQKIMLEPDRGSVKEIFVKEGDKVKKGDKLFSYHNPEGQMLLKEKAIDLEMANITINQKSKEVESLRKQLSKAEDEEKGEIREQLNQAEIDLKVANLDAQKARMMHEEEQKKVNNSIVTAKVNGIVQKIDEDQQQKQQTDEETGSESSGGTFIQIVNTEAAYVEGTVNELVKDGLKVGLEVNVASRKDPEQTWSGKIAEIGKLPVEQSEEDVEMDMYSEDPSNPNASKYPFKVELENHEGLEFGYHVFIELVDEESASEEIVLPFEYIVQEEKPYVWVVKEETLVKQEVELGAEKEDGMLIVVKKGLKLDDYILFPEDSLKEGKKVTIDDSIEEDL